ncbi:MAG TPA: SoxR reducing system RseC family protein, partial [Rhodocyclaceae bacterium]|nr:SoxR reducing system RseC family protein [Rhodocyclaceae bacterium]
MPAISEVTAKVTALEGAEVWLEIAATGCGRCNEPGGCGGQKLSGLLASGPKVYRVKNSIGAKVGDCVRLGIPASTLRRGATLVYVLPLLALVL